MNTAINISKVAETSLKRLQLHGGNALSLLLTSGDTLTITDTEGNQPCAVLSFDRNGDNNTTQITVQKGEKDNNHVANHPLTSTQIITLIKENNLSVKDKYSALMLFAEKNSAAGRSVSLLAQSDCLCVIDALGDDMLVDKQTPPTALQIDVTHSIGSDSKYTLPPPLENNKIAREVHIDKCTAQAYQVKKGEYIQIIDVEGHQCSDFQAFATSDLDNRIELGIDPTVTRSLMGSAYPTPGIFDKYYNQNSVALVEVIQDTVGQHDTFGVACNAKIYEDKGYPGHINCTDNFNQALSKYHIAARPNWVAVNLFFNTNVEECKTIASDVSWSRPGDYVLLKALTDLVCVSSACPDDTSPVNNWCPSDIHIRIYANNCHFNSGSALRVTPEAIHTMTKETGFHPHTAKLTRNFIDYNGYWLAQDYTNHGAIKEYWACREDAVIMDLSPLRKFEIYGQDAEALMQYAITRDVRKLAVGQVVYSAICYDNGGMLDDGTLFRLNDNNFRWVCGNDYNGLWLRELAAKKKMNVWVKSSTDQLHNIAVQGPKSRDILKQIIWQAKTQPIFEELGWFRFSICRIGDEQGIPVIVSRTGYTGELGYEIFCHPKDAANVWQTVWQAGKAYNLTPLGLDALDMIRIEAGLIFAGYEFCDQTNPFEAGIGFSVPLNTKTEDFVGKEALLKRQQNPERTLFGLEIADNEIAEHNDGVYIDRQQIGVVTSATRSPILKKNIALARLSVDAVTIGSNVTIGKLDGHQKRLPATVVAFPFYDPDKKRVKM